MRSRPFAVTIMLLAVLYGGSGVARGTDEPAVGELAQEMRELRRQVEELTRRVEKLEQPPAEAAWCGPADDWQRRGPDAEALSKIQLPPDPTRQEVREYVRQIMLASEHQNTYSSTDPQVSMLRRVGPQNVDILMDQIAYSGRGSAAFYVPGAVIALAGPEHKELILESLPLAPQLASVVLQYGWADDAREVLLGELGIPESYLPREWLQAVASLGDEEALEALKLHFVEGLNRRGTFDILNRMPGVENLNGLVKQAWERAKHRAEWDALDVAQLAVRYGHEDALAMLVRYLDSGEDRWGRMSRIRSSLLRHTEARGTPRQMVEWYEQNSDRLYWDEAARMFRVREGQACPDDARDTP